MADLLSNWPFGSNNLIISSECKNSSDRPIGLFPWDDKGPKRAL